MKEKDSILCLQYLLPLQVVPEAPPHPVIDGERLRIVYNGYLMHMSEKLSLCFLTGGPGIPAGPWIPL